jgi:hypothetical protein
MKIAGSVSENQRILIAVDSGTYNLRKATCYTTCKECDGYSGVAVVPGSFSIAVNGTQQLNFMGTWNFGTQFDLTVYATWTSDHTSVATVTDGPGYVRGVSPGSANISAAADNLSVQAVIFAAALPLPAQLRRLAIARRERSFRPSQARIRFGGSTGRLKLDTLRRSL